MTDSVQWPAPMVVDLAARIARDPAARARLRRSMRADDPGTDPDALALVAPYLHPAASADEATVAAGVAGLMAMSGDTPAAGIQWRRIPHMLAARLSEHRADQTIRQLVRADATSAARIRILRRVFPQIEPHGLDWTLLYRDLLNLSNPERRDTTVRRWIHDYAVPPSDPADDEGSE